MAIVRDCGPFEAKVGFSFGVEFRAHASPEAQREANAKLEKHADEIRAMREKMELELLDFCCDLMGYTEDRVRELVAQRTDEENDAIEQEKAGRAEKNRRRAGRT